MPPQQQALFVSGQAITTPIANKQEVPRYKPITELPRSQSKEKAIDKSD
jgi:hypothetical protein